jgi:hypothetical protein
MKQREFIAVLGGAAVWSLVASARQSKMPVVGVLATRSRNELAADGRRA